MVVGALLGQNGGGVINFSFRMVVVAMLSQDLEEATPEDGDATGPVEVHELEDVCPALGHHGHAHQEQEHAEPGRKLSSYRPETGLH